MTCFQNGIVTEKIPYLGPERGGREGFDGGGIQR